MKYHKPRASRKQTISLEPTSIRRNLHQWRTMSKWQSVGKHLSLMLGLMALILIAACGDDSTDPAETPTSQETASAGQSTAAPTAPATNTPETPAREAIPVPTETPQPAHPDTPTPSNTKADRAVTPVPEPTLAAAPTVVATPSPTAIRGARDPADFTDEELAEIAVQLGAEFLDAVRAEPDPDLERAMATYSEACQPDPEEFAAQVDQLLLLLQLREFTNEIMAVKRLPETSEAVIVSTWPRLNGENIAGITRSLMVYENGRWLDSDCDQARARYLSTEEPITSTPGPTHIETRVPEHSPISSPPAVAVLETGVAADPLSLSAGGAHNCILSLEGLAMCWGSDEVGQSSAPENMAFTSISSGGWHTCALQDDGMPVCWGADLDESDFGQVTPPQEPLAAISSGTFHSCGLRVDGTPVCWGANAGDIYLGQTEPPAENAALTSISSSWWHSCGLREDGTAVCWGGNSFGQSPPPEELTFPQISAGRLHTCALATDGSLACWELVSGGQTAAPEGRDFTAVSSGDFHTCALRTDLTPICWGPRAKTTTRVKQTRQRMRGLSPSKAAAGTPAEFGRTGR